MSKHIENVKFKNYKIAANRKKESLLVKASVFTFFLSVFFIIVSALSMAIYIFGGEVFRELMRFGHFNLSIGLILLAGVSLFLAAVSLFISTYINDRLAPTVKASACSPMDVAVGGHASASNKDSVALGGQVSASGEGITSSRL